MSRGLKVVLVASLVLNVFIAGAVGGLLYTRAYKPTHAHRGGLLAHAADDLSPADQAAFQRMLRDHVRAVRPLLQDARRSRRDVLDRLSSEPFDRAAAGAAMARARDDEVKARATLEDAILDFTATLTPQARARMAAAIQRGAPVRWGAPRPPVSAGSGGPPGAGGSPPGSAQSD